jgi:hypothetical protein
MPREQSHIEDLCRKLETGPRITARACFMGMEISIKINETEMRVRAVLDDKSAEIDATQGIEIDANVISNYRALLEIIRAVKNRQYALTGETVAESTELSRVADPGMLLSFIIKILLFLQSLIPFQSPSLSLDRLKEDNQDAIVTQSMLVRMASMLEEYQSSLSSGDFSQDVLKGIISDILIELKLLIRSIRNYSRADKSILELAG